MVTKKIINFESPCYIITKSLLSDQKICNQNFKIHAHIPISPFIHLLIHSFNKHGLCTYHVSGTTLNAGSAEMNDIWPLSSRHLLHWLGSGSKNEHWYSLWAGWQKHLDQFHIFWRKCMKTTNLWLEKGEFLSPFPRSGSGEGILPSFAWNTRAGDVEMNPGQYWHGASRKSLLEKARTQKVESGCLRKTEGVKKPSRKPQLCKRGWLCG